jgi:hypothetical protein
MCDVVTVVVGLHRINRERIPTEWDSAAMSTDWAENEAVQSPDPWLSASSQLHALRRMALLGDAKADRLLMTLWGSDADRQRQLTRSTHRVAKEAQYAVSQALSMLVVHTDKIGVLVQPPGYPY